MREQPRDVWVVRTEPDADGGLAVAQFLECEIQRGSFMAALRRHASPKPKAEAVGLKEQA
jgi:hypothetical protein